MTHRDTRKSLEVESVLSDGRLLLSSAYTAALEHPCSWDTCVRFRGVYECPRAALVRALLMGVWGQQPDGFFLRKGSSGRYYWAVLEAPGRRGPVAVAIQDEDGEGPGLKELRTLEEAWVFRGKEREERRACQQEYRRLLDEAELALASGRALTYHPGQRGGVFVLGTKRQWKPNPWGGSWQDADLLVSAPGVMRRLGLADVLPKTARQFRLPPAALAEFME